jgi:hypothetical protein
VLLKATSERGAFGACTPEGVVTASVCRSRGGAPAAIGIFYAARAGQGSVGVVGLRSEAIAVPPSSPASMTFRWQRDGVRQPKDGWRKRPRNTMIHLDIPCFQCPIFKLDSLMRGSRAPVRKTIQQLGEWEVYQSRPHAPFCPEATSAGQHNQR